MLKNTLILGLAVLGLGTMSQAHAEFVKGGLFNATDNLSILDTTTGMEWASLNVTKGKSLLEVEEMTKAGGIMEGWRFATLNEVESVLLQFYPNSVFGLEDPGYHDSPSLHFSGSKYRTTNLAIHRTFGGQYVYYQINTYSSIMVPYDELGFINLTFSVNNPSNIYSTANYNYVSGRYVPYESFPAHTQGSISSSFLVSTGGHSYASIQDPSINMPPTGIQPEGSLTDVPTPFLPVALFGLIGVAALRKRNEVV